MSWQEYVANLKSDKNVADAAIFGYTPGKESLWAGSDGWLRNITVEEIKLLVSSDRSTVFTKGLTLASVKCTVLRDNLYTDDGTMDIKTKSQGGEPTHSICVGRSNLALFFAMGHEGIECRHLNKNVHRMAHDLRTLNF